VGVREPYEMHLACYEILTAVGNARAKYLLATAYEQLQRYADKITDQQLHHSFWQAPAHRKIRAL
jgi:hypothetical protein